MYPHVELKQLALRKINLRRDIAVRRAACASAATRATKPLIWVDRAVALFQRIAPFVPVLSAPLALFAARKSSVKTSLVQTAMKWGPLLFQATRYASTAFSRKAPAPAPSRPHRTATSLRSR